MTRNGTPLPGLILLGAIAIAAAVFGFVNWQWLEQRHLLEREGIVAVAHVEGVTISHKACSSSLLLDWTDSSGRHHSGRFATCFANRSVGDAVGIRYLGPDPDIAMIDVGQGGLPDGQYRTGVLIGVLVAGVIGAVAIKRAAVK